MEKMSACTLPELQNNLLKFKALMDKIDAFNFNVNFSKNIEFDAVDELEIQEIQKVSKMKELLRNYKFIVEKQGELVRILNKNEDSKYDPQFIMNQISLLTIPGVEQCKKFLQDQKNLIIKNNQNFEATCSKVDQSLTKLQKNKEDLFLRMSLKKAELMPPVQLQAKKES